MSDPDPVADLVGAIAGDLDAGFVRLYDAHRRAVFSTALQLSGRWADAEDLTAEAFLRAYQALGGYDRRRILELRPRAWLLTILVNVWRNSRRQATRRPQTAPLQGTEPAVGDSVEDAAERCESERTLGRLLAQLPEKERVAVVLRHVADLPIGEIASVMGVRDGTAKSHISRGLERLRRLHARQEVNHGRS